MSLQSWLSSLTQPRRRRALTAAKFDRRRASRRRVLFESLEDRRLLAVVLYNQNFENPTGFVDNGGDVNINIGVNQLYGNQPTGFTFAQQFTVETLRITGNQAFGTGYSDPQGIGGNYALGMLAGPGGVGGQNDLLGLSFNVQGKTFLNFRLNVSSIDLSGFGGPFNSLANSIPRFDIVMYDNPGGATTLSGNGTILDSAQITGLPSTSRSVFNWSEHTLALNAGASTNGNVTVRIDLVDSPSYAKYAAMDNFLIASSDAPGDVGAVNDNVPVFTAGASQTFTIPEESGNGTVVGNAVATDADLPGDTLTYSITAGNSSGGFAINASGRITIANASVLDLDFDDGTAHVAVLTVNVNDGRHDVTQQVTVNVSPINDNAPIFTSSNAISVAEGTTPVVTLNATDADLPAPTVTYAITGGVDQSKFQIVGGNQLRFIAAPNFESPADSGSNNVYDVQVTAADAIPSGVSERTAAWFNLAGVMGWTEAPFGNDWVPVTAVNTNSSGVTLPYSGQVLPAGKILLHAGPQNGGKDQEVVRWTAPTNGTLTLDTTFFKLHSTKVNAYVIHNGVQIAGGDTGTGTFAYTSGTITVAANDTIDFIISTKQFGYGASSTGFDANINFISSAGSQTSYAAGADLKANQLGPNFLSNPNGAWSYGTAASVGGALTLFRTPTVGRTTVQNIAVTVTNVSPTTPVDSNGLANTVAEGAAVGTVVGLTAAATDPLGPAVTFSLSDNAGGRFAIDAHSGVVTVANAALLNFEDAASHNITVVANDGSGAVNATSSQTFTISVSNVSPTSPVDSDDGANEVMENSAAGTVVGIRVSSIDPNGIASGSNVTFSLSDNAGGRFAINANTGVVTVANGALLDYETATSHTITVRASDGAAGTPGTSTQSFTINVLNVTAVISGTVFVDANGNGLYDGGTETGIDGVIVELLNELGVVLASDVTSMGGVYGFEVDDEFATYRIRQIQPTGVTDGAAILGSAAVDSVLSSNEMQLTLDGVNASDYDFTEVGQAVQSGDTATIGFWQNKNGQALIKQAGAALVPWLKDNFGNIFGTRFSDGVGGDNPDEVASFYKAEFFDKKLKGTSKVDAQFMSLALATFFTSSNLSGGSVAASYGFRVTETGIGTKVVNVGSSGAAFNVANDTNMTIMSMLLATNSLTGADANGDGYSNAYDTNGDGVLDEDEKALRALANTIYSAINENGDI